METKMTHEESLRLITDVINRSRTNYQSGSVFLLVWGWMVLLACIIHLALIQLEYYSIAPIAWAICMPIAGILSIAVRSKRKNSELVKTHLDHVISSVWSGFGFTIVVLVILGFTKGWNQVYPVFIALYGLGTFTTGSILKYKPLIIGGVFAWIVATVCIFLSFEWQLVCLALAIIGSYLIPGYLIKRDEKS